MPLIEKLDRLSGGLILGAGIAAGLSAIAGNPAPTIALAIWSWVDQKNEATKLVRDLVAKFPRKISAASGYLRSETVAAAHTILVVDAFFNALQDVLGPARYGELELSGKDKEYLIGHGSARAHSLAEVIYGAQVPAPSATHGFEENLRLLRPWMIGVTRASMDFFEGLSAWRQRSPQFAVTVTDAAIARYKANFVALARDVPEFFIWTLLSEQSATRASVQEVRAELLAAISEARNEALIQTERLLAVGRPQARPAERGNRDIVYRANRGALTELIVPPGAIQGASEIAFPSVEQIYVEPRYRRCTVGRESQHIADEDWWGGQEVRENISVYLAAHISSHEAATLPLLVLGHPGAGKSLLTKVLSARLPESGYTAVRVPLRRVRSDKPLYEQIQEALDESTSGRVRWATLADESRDGVRVILLDGLDELLQAAPGAHRTFFRQIADFQRHELSQGLPVVVLVTSRTIVADQVELPAGTPVLKLEDFSESQIRKWLSSWEICNSHGLATGQVQRLAPNVALNQIQLARQPLLLLMLAVYAADAKAEPLTDKLSTAALYRQLLRNFAAREVLKLDRGLSGADLTEAVEDHLWALTVAAFAMFNRGHQYVSDYQLGADLSAFDKRHASRESREEDLGRHVASQFFFIHSAEARVAGSSQPARSYEFLHATFGEYLVAQQIIAMLLNLEREERKRAARDADALLFALLSCQVLVGRISILELTIQLARELPQTQVERIADAIDGIIRNYACRQSFDGYPQYKATPSSRVLTLAVYSLNMVGIRLALAESNSFDIKEVWAEEPEDALRHWQAMVKHWAAALDSGSWAAVTSAIEFHNDSVRFMPRMRLLVGSNFQDILYARLLGDRETEANLRFGVAVRNKSYYYMSDDDWEDAVLASLFSIMHASGQVAEPILPPPPPETGLGAIRRVSIAAARALKYCDTSALPLVAEPLIRFLFSLPGITPDPYALTLSLLSDPSLAKKIPELLDPRHYEQGGWGVWFLLANDDGMDENIRTLRSALQRKIPSAPDGKFIGLKEATVMLRQVVRAFRRRPAEAAKGSEWSRQKLSGGSAVHFNRLGTLPQHRAAFDSSILEPYPPRAAVVRRPAGGVMPRPGRRIRE